MNLQQGIVLLRHDPLRGILPLLRIRVERNRLVIGRPVRIGKARGDTELARPILQRHRIALRPTGHGCVVYWLGSYAFAADLANTTAAPII